MLTNVQGLNENRIAPYLAKKYEKGQALVITSSSQRAQRIATDLAFFCDTKIFVLPDFDSAGFKYDAKSRNSLEDYLNAYCALLKGTDCIVVAPVLSALKKLQPKDAFIKNVFSCDEGSTIDREILVGKLAMLGYEKVPLVESRGQFAVRGDIIDFFCPCDEYPVRIELFDDEIDSIRSFDPATQRSVERLFRTSVSPARLVCADDNVPQILEAIRDGMNSQYLERYIGKFYKQCSFVWDYMKNPQLVAVDDPSRIAEVLDFFTDELSKEEIPKADIKEKAFPVPEDLLLINDFNSSQGTFYFTPFAQQIRFADRLDKLESVSVRQAPSSYGHMDVLENELKRFAAEGYKITIACGSQDRCENLKEFLSRIGLDRKVSLSEKSLSSGSEFPDEKLLFLSEQDVFRSAKKNKRHHKKGQQIKAFTDIKKGDYIVHEAHGVGQFVGVERLTVDGSSRDYLKVQYQGADVLYVPVDQMESIQKYVGGEGTAPKISKLSGGDWLITKQKAKAAVKDMAEEFIKASAQRQIAKGFCFAEDSSWQKEFEDAFPYVETEDQLRCTEEIKLDMQSDKAMDRLLCGDVGYGKTEVAARAIFKALEQGKQVAVLVPTTILASQHYHTFIERFAGYPFAIEMLSRFRSASQQDKIAAAISRGDIDLVVGTHRLLSSDVKFKDLGLLVVDEEQRFGVEHKEAIKRLKAGVDVLTLSATPIPRTLHMSLVGVRDMSVIEEPPEDRFPVQTYVTEQDDKLIADAARREIGRGGQVYLVFNRVRGIQAEARRIQALLPEAKIAVAHGQMNETELEDIMMDFQAAKYDILITTTIIESGLDIPNVNTLIVIDSDKFGLSQLYQLRGRVGRSNRMAYAYLMYKKDKVLSEIAEKRLQAIKEFTEFGSGFRIAMRDLELRGAGNLLGVEQSGHMLSVGYEMYCKLVEEAVEELRGEAPADKPLQSDTAVELGVSAYLPESYVADELIRLDMYKRIASISSDEERLEAYDELSDRFGEVPAEADNLLDVALIRNTASRLGIFKVVKQLSKIVFLFDEKNALSAEGFANVMDKFGVAATIYGGVEPRITLAYGKNNILSSALALLKALGGNAEA